MFNHKIIYFEAFKLWGCQTKENMQWKELTGLTVLSFRCGLTDAKEFNYFCVKMEAFYKRLSSFALLRFLVVCLLKTISRASPSVNGPMKKRRSPFCSLFCIGAQYKYSFLTSVTITDDVEKVTREEKLNGTP
jgi:hypothetical protein